MSNFKELYNKEIINSLMKEYNYTTTMQVPRLEKIVINIKKLQMISEWVKSHHEKWDGTGYPNRLKGEEIPLIARIISAVDSHDVMVNDRPYHKAMPEEDAIAELKRCSGTQFDPDVVEAFVRLLEREELPKEQMKEATANA